MYICIYRSILEIGNEQRTCSATTVTRMMALITYAFSSDPCIESAPKSFVSSGSSSGASCGAPKRRSPKEPGLGAQGGSQHICIQRISLSLSIYLSICIYVCVCVCVFLYTEAPKRRSPQGTRAGAHGGLGLG